MSENNEMSEKEMSGVSGGVGPKKQLSDYIKRIETDKSKILVDMGEGTQLKPESHISAPDDGSLIIIRRERTHPQTNADLVIK